MTVSNAGAGAVGQLERSVYPRTDPPWKFSVKSRIYYVGMMTVMLRGTIINLGKNLKYTSPYIIVYMYMYNAAYESHWKADDH